MYIVCAQQHFPLRNSSVFCACVSLFRTRKTKQRAITNRLSRHFVLVKLQRVRELCHHEGATLARFPQRPNHRLKIRRLLGKDTTISLLKCHQQTCRRACRQSVRYANSCCGNLTNWNAVGSSSALPVWRRLSLKATNRVLFAELNTFRDKNHRRVVERLRVYCPHRPRESEHSGCEWVGELGEVEKHLNCTLSRGNRTEGCQYVLLKCKYCKEDVVRSSLEEHESSLCSKRIVKYPFCDYSGEYTDVNGPHKKRCPNFPVACQQCKRMVGKRDLELHISKECPMTIVACEIQQYGCSKTFPRKDMAAHMEKNHAVHLKMVINRMKVAEQRHKEELARLSSKVVSLRSENHEINDTLVWHMHRSFSLSRALHQEEERNSRALHQEEERNEELVLALSNTRRELKKDKN